ncbi:hypothetical protein PIB30_092000 [Stylosanthes scabra]|uniref:Uncharacterized protein n=1 Tax=Stylosanthes scabra TaxID=79078 RepID=A0ABU6YSZ9_9FABA|nr:hypothetical protein [Stylosanthes scabra]
MENIRHSQHHSPPPHQSPQLHQFHEPPFSPSPQYQSQHHFEEEQPAGEATFEAAYGPQNYGWGQLYEDMTTLKANQQEFYDSILALKHQWPHKEGKGASSRTRWQVTFGTLKANSDLPPFKRDQDKASPSMHHVTFRLGQAKS